MLKRCTMVLCALMVAGAGFSAGADAADVLEYDVDTLLYYKDTVGYNVDLKVRWKDPGASKSEVVRVRSEEAKILTVVKMWGKNSQIDLNAFNAARTSEGKSTIAEGAEVWLVVDIQAGDTVSCRKDGKKFYFKASVGQEAKFKTGGATLNNNRCKIVKTPDTARNAGAGN